MFTVLIKGLVQKLGELMGLDLSFHLLCVELLFFIAFHTETKLLEMKEREENITA